MKWIVRKLSRHTINIASFRENRRASVCQTNRFVVIFTFQYLFFLFIVFFVKWVEFTVIVLLYLTNNIIAHRRMQNQITCIIINQIIRRARTHFFSPLISRVLIVFPFDICMLVAVLITFRRYSLLLFSIFGFHFAISDWLKRERQCARNFQIDNAVAKEERNSLFVWKLTSNYELQIR